MELKSTFSFESMIISELNDLYSRLLKAYFPNLLPISGKSQGRTQKIHGGKITGNYCLIELVTTVSSGKQGGSTPPAPSIPQLGPDEFFSKFRTRNPEKDTPATPLIPGPWTS